MFAFHSLLFHLCPFLSLFLIYFDHLLFLSHSFSFNVFSTMNVYFLRISILRHLISRFLPFLRQLLSPLFLFLPIYRRTTFFTIPFPFNVSLVFLFRVCIDIFLVLRFFRACISLFTFRHIFRYPDPTPTSRRVSLSLFPSRRILLLSTLFSLSSSSFLARASFLFGSLP